MATRISILFFVLASTFVTAQNKLREFFDSYTMPVTWLGVDYAKTRYIGELGTVDEFEIKRNYNKINDLILNEPEKFDINSAFRKDYVDKEIDFIIDRNRTANLSDIIIRSYFRGYRLNYDSVQKIVESYELPKSLSGIGIVFVAEVIDKNRELTTFHVACFDMRSKEILFIERMTGEASGFGFRNHWGKCVNSALEEIDRNLFREWRRKYRWTKNS